jgi:hypothetical protein
LIAQKSKSYISIHANEDVAFFIINRNIEDVTIIIVYQFFLKLFVASILYMSFYVSKLKYLAIIVIKCYNIIEYYKKLILNA